MHKVCNNTDREEPRERGATILIVSMVCNLVGGVAGNAQPPPYDDTVSPFLPAYDSRAQHRTRALTFREHLNQHRAIGPADAPTLTCPFKGVVSCWQSH